MALFLLKRNPVKIKKKDPCFVFHVRTQCTNSAHSLGFLMWNSLLTYIKSSKLCGYPNQFFKKLNVDWHIRQKFLRIFDCSGLISVSKTLLHRPTLKRKITSG